MVKPSLFAILIAALSAAPALAACPPAVPGNASEAIRANEQRILCLQEEVNRDTRMRQLELEMRANQNAIQDLQLQRRFDQLPRQPILIPYPQPQPFVPN